MSSVKAFKLAVAVAAFAVTGSTAQAQSNAALWQGAYIGVHAGGDFGKFSNGNFDEKVSGLVGGLHAGYNWQSGSTVFGIEGDASFSGAKVSQTIGVLREEMNNSFLGSLRGRVGYASGAALLYGTAGLAFGTHEFSASIPGASVSFKETRIGYVIGLGAEYAFSSNMSARIEGLHYGFKDVFEKDSGVKYNTNVIRAGLSYKF
jgi:outer membrane immunogenic protein